MSPADQKTATPELEEIINKAIKKIGGRKENDLCKFLPALQNQSSLNGKDGYMHHFTMRKMKSEQPHQLSEMIRKHIVEVPSPAKVAPKQRAARGSRKKRDVITLTRGDVERLLDISRQVGDKEMVSKLSPKKSLPAIKRDLIKAIRDGRTDQELWNAFVEATALQFAHQHSSNSGLLNGSFLQNSPFTPRS